MKLCIDKKILIERIIDYESRKHTHSLNGYWGIIIPVHALKNESYYSAPKFIQSGSGYKNCYILHVNEFINDTVYNETDFNFNYEHEDEIENHKKYCREVLETSLKHKISLLDSERLEKGNFEVEYIEQEQKSN